MIDVFKCNRQKFKVLKIYRWYRLWSLLTLLTLTHFWRYFMFHNSKLDSSYGHPHDHVCMLKAMIILFVNFYGKLKGSVSQNFFVSVIWKVLDLVWSAFCRINLTFISLKNRFVCKLPVHNSSILTRFVCNVELIHASMSWRLKLSVVTLVL